MEKDEELERIRVRKFEHMMKKTPEGETEKTDQRVAKQSQAKPKDITDASFSGFVKSHPFVVVDCWAPWCGPCRIISPIIEELARDYAGKIAFGKLNVDENQMTAIKYGVMSIPTLLVFKNGDLADRIIGAMPRKMLEQKITSLL